jgi:hypothetical protein
MYLDELRSYKENLIFASLFLGYKIYVLIYQNLNPLKCFGRKKETIGRSSLGFYRIMEMDKAKVR